MAPIITESTSKTSPKSASKPAVKTKERVQFDFSEEMLQKLDAIMKKTGVATRAEAVRNALRVYDWFVDTDPDNNIKVIGENNEIIQAFKAKLLL